MKQNNSTRKSHCNLCGKRLSVKTGLGTIRWQPGHVDDTGIYCESCLPLKISSKDPKIVHA
jgi:hypothetical protein